MTWKDIKLATLQKMFAAEGNTIPQDESTADYLAGMPQVANEALQRLSTAGKFIIKSVSIAHNPVPNLIPDYEAKSIHPLGEFVFSGGGAMSYYFEFVGKGNVEITVGEVKKSLFLDSKSKYQSFRGMIDNPERKEVKLTFQCDYPSAVKNVALYAFKFDEISEVPTYAEVVRYNLRNYADDFYQLGDNQIYYEGDYGKGYLQKSDYFRESDSILVIDREDAGSYTIYYRAYPVEITNATSDAYELPLDREVAVLLPLYMASQLYKDDDNGIATAYRNEFEVALESLSDSSLSQGDEKWVSESGWI